MVILLLQRLQLKEKEKKNIVLYNFWVNMWNYLYNIAWKYKK